LRVLITGSAGFIGFHLARHLLERGEEIFGIDNFNDYYSVKLKRERHALLEGYENYRWHECDLADMLSLQSALKDFKPECVVNLAAQVGVRYSNVNPHIYAETNVLGFLNLLECCRDVKPQPRLIYASSSSVYGGNQELPFCEQQVVDTPISLYAATKKTNELMAHCYNHLYGIQCIGLRFFTVYGPWGRPDMAVWLFAEAIRNGEPLKVFNRGEMLRDFVYIDDIVAGVANCIYADNLPGCDIFNIGSHRSERLLDVIELIAAELGVKSPRLELLPMQDGDLPATYASIEKLHQAVGFRPSTSVSEGIPKFIKWFQEWEVRKC